MYNIGLLIISGNDRLAGIVLGKVSKASWNLIVVAIKGLYGISGLENLAEVGGNVQNEYNGVLNKSGFDRMTHVGSSLDIHHSFRLSDISGLSELAKVYGDMIIAFNGQIVNTTGLGKLTQVGASFEIK